MTVTFGTGSSLLSASSSSSTGGEDIFSGEGSRSSTCNGSADSDVGEDESVDDGDEEESDGWIDGASVAPSLRWTDVECESCEEQLKIKMDPNKVRVRKSDMHA